VQSCSTAECGEYAIGNVRKSSVPVSGVRASGGRVTNLRTVTFSWDDYAATTGNGEEAATYHVQVARDCAFGNVVRDVQTDATEFTAPERLYEDGDYWVRVQAVDASGSPLTWGPGPHSGTDTCGSPLVRVDRSTRALAPTAPGVARAGRWVSRRVPGGSALVADGHGQQLSFSFTGSTATVDLCQGPASGTTGVYVDGRLVAQPDTRWRFSRCGKSVVTLPVAPDQAHTVTVVATGRPRSKATMTAVRSFTWS